MKVGTNLSAGVNPGTTEHPFINIFKTGAGWTAVNGSPGAWINGTHATPALYTSWLDSNGYVTSFSGAPFTGVATTVLNNWPPPYYKSGSYIFLYDGTGSFDFGNDASIASGAGTGRIVLNVTPSAAGIPIIQYATGAGAAQATNFRLVHSSDEAALANGEIFTPEFVARLDPFDTVRFIKWQGIDTQNYQVDWADRTHQSYVFWFGSRLNAINNWCDPNGALDGVPVEVQVALCNKINANGWFNVPALASDDYGLQFGSLVHSTLNSNLKAYLEKGNELWNQQLGTQNLGFITGSISGSTLTVSSVWTGKFTGTISGTTLTISGASGFVFPNQTISGAGVTAGTRIVSGSGTTWVVDTSQTVGPVAMLADNSFGGPFLRGGVAGVQINDSGVNIPGNEIQIVSQLPGGTSGGAGTYSLSKSVGTVASQTINLLLQGVTQVANICLNQFPYLQSGSFSASQLNNQWICAAAPRTFDLWKAAWGADTARLVRVFGGFGGNDGGYNQPQLANTVAIAGAETASFTGAISGTTLTVSGVTGTIVAGHKVSGAGVAAATYIQSGSGAAWVVNNSQTVGSVSMTSRAWVGTVASNSDAMCCDGYFGDLSAGAVPPDNATLDQFFQEILTGGTGWAGAYPGGYLKARFDTTAVNFATCQNPSYGNGIALLTYEGGWNFQSGNDAALETLFISAQSDPRMHTVYTALLNGVQTAGSQLFNNFTDISSHAGAPFGFDWGALTTVLQTTSPRYAALLAFINPGGHTNLKGDF